MTRARQLGQIRELSEMILNRRLEELHASAAAREKSLTALRDLVPRPGEALCPVAGAQAALRYARWADARRAEINLTLARQTARWMEAQQDARAAFGRAEVLKKLQEKALRATRKPER